MSISTEAYAAMAARTVELEQRIAALEARLQVAEQRAEEAVRLLRGLFRGATDMGDVWWVNTDAMDEAFAFLAKDQQARNHYEVAARGD